MAKDECDTSGASLSPELQRILLQLGEENTAKRAEAAKELAEMSSSLSLVAPVLLQILENEASPLRIGAAIALQAAGGATAVPALVQALGDQDRESTQLLRMSCQAPMLAMADGKEDEDEDLDAESVCSSPSSSSAELRVSQVWEYPMSKAEKHLRLAQLLDKERVEAVKFNHQTSVCFRQDITLLEEGIKEAKNAADAQREDMRTVLRQFEMARVVMDKMAQCADLPDGARESLNDFLNSPLPGEGAACEDGVVKNGGRLASGQQDLRLQQTLRNLYVALERSDRRGTSNEAPLAIGDIESPWERAKAILCDMCTGWFDESEDVLPEKDHLGLASTPCHS